MEENKKPNTDSKWVVIGQKEITKESIQRSFQYNREYLLAKDKYTTTGHDNFMALALAVRNKLVEQWLLTQEKYHNENPKRVYYLSMEFLIGRLLKNNMINLNCEAIIKSALKEMDLDIEDITEQEVDAGLGNGGLGRLAACFLESMATLGIPSHGYGIRYDYGIFKQKIINGYQIEYVDEWLKPGNPWEFIRPEYAVKVKFKGNVEKVVDHGKTKAKWVNTDDILAMPYDTPVAGYKNGIVNTLRLWSARSVEEFDLKHFNAGNYEQSVYDKIYSENISKVLYPNDDFYKGRELRLSQEYFFTASSIADIIRRFKKDNKDIRDLPKKVAIQLNDTHPTLAIAELMRILIDEENIEWAEAWNTVVNTFAYTNHTVMPEALEKWSVKMFEELLPRHLQIIYEINAKFLDEVDKKFPKDIEHRIRLSLIEEGEPDLIQMAYLGVIGSHSTNGVSELHSNLLKTHVFKDFYEMYPERFNNKTNGVTQRRWLLESNPKLSNLITEAIGLRWITDALELEKILSFKEDLSFRKRWQEIKTENKESLSNFINKTTGILVNPESIFDIQVKRIHEYKRQSLFCFYIISEYLKIKKNPNTPFIPRTFIFGGKAAPGYDMAKLTIKFINNIGETINNDKTIHDKIKVVFIENYGVSVAEKIFPAGELSEQISTAGTEASGTGCMKFMMNGALTIGTLDGANIEILDAVGCDHMFIFGLKTNEIQELKNHGVSPNEFINQSPTLQEIINLIKNNFFSPNEHGIFEPILNSLSNIDRFFVCADFESYLKAQESVSILYKNSDEWIKKSIINVAKSGRFSSDRTIKEYLKDIWGK
ncbi:MAG: glycogen/starch/alpha-glucan phosphorylase [Candidatus Firestonebacteria bacterium]